MYHPPTTNLQVRLPSRLVERLRRMAAERQRLPGHILADILEAYVDKAAPVAPPAKLPPGVKPTPVYARSGPVPKAQSTIDLEALLDTIPDE